jgi:multidrug efflux pump subunit AcrA (membrane-fusion protein)
MFLHLKQRFAGLIRFSFKYKKSSLVVIIAIIVVGYYGFHTLWPRGSLTRYVVSKTATGTIESTVSGSGQVSAASQVDIKSKVSGEVLSISVKSGDPVKVGDIIARIDDRDARVELENARIGYQKLTKPADTITILQSEGSLRSAKDSVRKSNDDLIKAYDGAVGVVDTMALDGTAMLSDLNNIFNNSSGFFRVINPISLTDTSATYIQDAGKSFDIANAKYNAYINKYKGISRASASTTIEASATEIYNTAKSIATAVKDAKAAVDRIIKNDQNDSPTSAALSAQSLLGDDMQKSTSLVNNAFGAVASIRSAQESLFSSTQLVVEKEQNLAETLAGADVLDVQSQALLLKQKEDAFANYVVRAPVSGVIAKVSIDVSNTISSGASVAIVISEKKKAVITLNEVDAVKVKAGQKARVTFDAIDGLTIPGVVDSIDLVGTVSQGVVSYGSTIAFEGNDTRIRSGMSATVDIIADSRAGVIMVPNAAIKKGARSTKYVEVFGTVPNERAAVISGFTSTALPTKVDVVTGLADDMNTEITSGLSGGEYVVKKTIVGTTTAASSAPSILSGLRTGGQGGQGGGAARRN